MGATGVFLEELKVLADETMREPGSDTSLVYREALLFKEYDFGEVLDVAPDGTFRVVSASLNVGELIAGEIEVKDLSLMRLTTAEFVTPSARRDDDTFLSHEAHVTFYGDDARGEDEGNIFIRENATLLDGFVGNANDLMLP